jgi:hypothetical protein
LPHALPESRMDRLALAISNLRLLLSIIQNQMRQCCISGGHGAGLLAIDGETKLRVGVGILDHRKIKLQCIGSHRLTTARATLAGGDRNSTQLDRFAVLISLGALVFAFRVDIFLIHIFVRVGAKP